MSERSNVAYLPSVCPPYPPCPRPERRLSPEAYKLLLLNLRLYLVVGADNDNNRRAWHH